MLMCMMPIPEHTLLYCVGKNWHAIFEGQRTYVGRANVRRRPLYEPPLYAQLYPLRDMGCDTGYITDMCRYRRSPCEQYNNFSELKDMCNKDND